MRMVFKRKYRGGGCKFHGQMSKSVIILNPAT